VQEILSECFGAILEQGQRNSHIAVGVVLFFRIDEFSWISGFQVSVKTCRMFVAKIGSFGTWNYSNKAILLPSRRSGRFVSGG